MTDTTIYFWLGLGAFLIFAEIITPGLVAAFVGLGALTVAGAVYYNYIDTIPSQLLLWFSSSIVYIFTLRLLVLRFYPSDAEKQDIDEDKEMIGKHVHVIQSISKSDAGRIRFGDSTWPALSIEDEIIPVGTQVEIIGRENISLIVKSSKKEN